MRSEEMKTEERLKVKEERERALVIACDKEQRGLRGVQCLCEIHFTQFLTFDLCLSVCGRPKQQAVSHNKSTAAAGRGEEPGR